MAKKGTTGRMDQSKRTRSHAHKAPSARRQKKKFWEMLKFDFTGPVNKKFWASKHGE